jgi:putative tricarboxylic transport membrane protein
MAGTRKAERIAAIALLVFSTAYTLSSLRLRMGRLSSPGPGLMPLLLGLTLTACALIYLFRQLGVRTGPGEPSSPAIHGSRTDHRVPLGIVAAVTAYPFLLAWLGFLVATALVVFGILLLLRFKTPGWSFLVGIVMTLLCYLLFARVLGVVLPAGPLENLLFKWF